MFPPELPLAKSNHIVTTTSKNYVKNPFKAKVLALFAEPDYKPSNKKELARELRLPPKDLSHLREILRDLEAQGKIVESSEGIYFRPKQLKKSQPTDNTKPSRNNNKKTPERNTPEKRTSEKKTPEKQAPGQRPRERERSPKRVGIGSPVIGRIDFPKPNPNSHRQGAYFIPNAETAANDERFKSGDLYVPGMFLGVAMHGDEVEVTVHEKPSRSKRTGPPKLEAHISRVVERGNPRIIGTFHKHGKNSRLVPDDSRLPETFDIVKAMPKAKNGHKVVCELVSWNNSRSTPVVKMIQVLGPPDAPGVDMESILHKHGLPMDFPPEVLAEAEKISLTIPPEEIAKREDWRDRDVFTIDPKTARDFDDAIHVRRLDPKNKDDGNKEGWELAVHIADVSHYVKVGTALDCEAAKRGNSCYLADRVIPMLPEKLSNGVCSLVPHQDRLTQAAIMRFDLNGNPIGARFTSAVIHSAHRYTYEEAVERMFWDDQQIADYENRDELPIIEHLQEAWRLASKIRERRFENGALDMDFPEVKVVMNANGEAIDIERSEYDESHQLIEEFMLVANESVALRTKNNQSPNIYRVHDDPDSEKLADLAETFASYGHKVHDLTIRKNLQKALQIIRGSHEEYALKLALLKSLKRASYTPDPLGHYGLAKVNYTHFTSPIRRYADLIVHRVLRSISEGKANTDPTPGQAALGDIAKHISTTERKASDAEQESQRLKMMEYLLSLAETDPGEKTREFSAMVTDIRPMGVFVELDDMLIRGVIKSEDLPHGYRFDEGSNQFLASSDGSDIGLGDPIKVSIARVERERQFIDFRLAGVPMREKKPRRASDRGKKRKPGGGGPKRKTKTRGGKGKKK